MGRSSHHSTSKVGRRRSQLGRSVKNVTVGVCWNCKSPVLPHRACASCGSTPKRKRPAQKSS